MAPKKNLMFNRVCITVSYIGKHNILIALTKVKLE
jgi:hypothetical protein